MTQGQTTGSMNSRLTPYINIGLLGFVMMFSLAIQLPIHEYGHYWAATSLGYDAEIKGSITMYGGHPISAFDDTVIRLSGGLLAGGVLLVFVILTRKPYGYGFLPAALMNFVYAPFDPSFGPQGEVLTTVAFVLPACSIFALYVRQVIMNERQ